MMYLCFMLIPSSTNYLSYPSWLWGSLMAISLDDALAAGALIAGILGLGGGATAHTRSRKMRNEIDDLQRETREKVIKLEERVEGMGKSVEQNMQDLKDDLRYIRESLDKLKDRK